MKQFLAKLSYNIKAVNDSCDECTLSFTHFLCFLDDQTLQEYNKLLSNVLAGKPENDECLEKAVLLYTLIITQVEKKESNTVQIDSEGKWLFSLVSFIGMEIFYRQEMIDGYEGFLYDGEVKFKSNEKLEELMKWISTK